MKQRNRKYAALLLALSLIVSLGAALPPLGGTRAERTVQAAESTFQDLNQQEIVEAMGAGWNLGNQMEANDGTGTPKEDAWTGVKVTDRLIRLVKGQGFKTIRIPVSYLSMIGEGPDYTIDSTWLGRVQEIVDWAMKHDMYVVLNIHGDGYSNVKGGWIFPEAEDQETIKAKYTAVWSQLAERFKDYDHHLIFESMNEIGAKIAEMSDGEKKTAAISAAYENINAYNQIFVDTVRSSGGNNDRRWLLIPGLNTDINYTAGDYGFKIPEDTGLNASIPEGQKRLMVSVHYYNPWAFCGQDDYNTTQWGEEGVVGKKVGYGQEDEMQDQFRLLKNKFTDEGYPVVIGEYGSIDKSKKKDSGIGKAGEADPENNSFRENYAETLCHCAIDTGCVPVYWDNGWNGDFGFGLFDRSSYKVTQAGIIAAIMSCYDKKEGTATAIALDKKTMELDMAEGGQKLQASLTPADAQDTIRWESSDPSVANVSYKGSVTPKGAGTCIITATVPGGAAAYCLVKVKQPETFKAGLYAQNAEDWNMLEGDDYLELTEDGGGNYTITLSGTKEQMSKLNTLFIKDVTVQRGVSETSILNSALFEVESLQFNGNDCSMSKKAFSYVEEDAFVNDKPTGKKTVPDICMLNYWYEPANCITDLKKNPGSNNGCSFPKEYYVDGTNTLTMKVTVKNAVLKKDYAKSEISVTNLTMAKDNAVVRPGNTLILTASVTPENTTEKILWFSENKNIAEVAQDGTVTGIKEGETIVHAMTYSGQDAVCKITVDEKAIEEPTASPSTDPGTKPSTEPSAKPSTEPSTKPSAEPSIKPGTEPSIVPSAEPSTEPSTKPSAESSAKPSTEPSKKPGGNSGAYPSASPQGSSGAPGKTLAKGTVFTVGNLKYKVTDIKAGKTAVAVQGPKSRKAKSLTIPAKVSKDGVSYAVTSVGDNAFKKCKKLKKITIGKNVVSIGKNAFRGDKALKKITVKTTKLKKVGKNALKGIHKKAVIIVPKKNLKKYKKLWKNNRQENTFMVL